MHCIFYRYPKGIDYERNKGANTAWWVMGACGVIVLSLFMLYCRVGVLTLSVLSRIEKVVLLVVSDICRKSETTCLVGEYFLIGVGIACVLFVCIALVVVLKNRQKPVILVL